MKVLCITGWCRNGSTIIGNILNEIPGFLHVGEIHFLWRNAAGKGANNLCGCGIPLTECPVWSPLLPGLDLHDLADAVVARQRACVRTRHTWRVLAGKPSSPLTQHKELMANTYHTVAERMGAEVIVDTSKIPGEAALLPFLDGVTPYFVHLVRDPRAVAYSWREPKQYVWAMPSWKSTAYWVGFNLACEAITRRYPDNSLFLRHEDFIADPAATIDTLLKLCGADPGANPLRGRRIDLHTNHTVTGNPDRFHTGETVVRERDDEWKTVLGKRAKLAASLMSWPLSKRYGY